MSTSSTPPSSDSPSSEPEAGNKRSSSSLLDTLTKGGRKKAKRQVLITLKISIPLISTDLHHNGSSLAIADLRPYGRVGQNFARGFSPFLNVTRAYFWGMREDLDGDADGEDPDEDEMPLEKPNDYAECIKGYKHIASHVPGFKKDMEGFKDNIGQLSDLIEVISNQARTTRTSDSGKLKFKVIAYIPKNVNASEDMIAPPIPAIASKAMRGYNHPVLARMLCPRHLRDKFDAEPNMVEQFKDGTIIASPGDWASFLYGDGEYDPEDPEVGLLRGHVLLRTVKHIYTGPSSGLTPTAGAGRGTRANNAKIHGITKLTGRHIAYAVVQVWFALSTMEAWGPIHGSFSLSELFSLVVELFEDDPSSDWVISTLAWYNEKVLGTKALVEHTPDSEPEADPVETLADRMRRKRREKAAANALASLSSSSS